MDQQKTVRTHYDPSVQHLRPEHPFVWQQILDHTRFTRTQAQCISHEIPPPHSEHQMARRNPKLNSSAEG